MISGCILWLLHSPRAEHNAPPQARKRNLKVLVTFDHELFFGQASGTPEKCLIEPGRALAAVAAEFGVPLCFFVDAGYLVALRRLAPTSATLRAQELAVRGSLAELARQGHELLLHVHPHWADAVWHGERWHFDLARYALSAFDEAAVHDIVQRQADELRPYTPDGQIHAYRAGGWAVQPFAPIGRALLAAGITTDSSVFWGGRDASGHGAYDFTHAPRQAKWRFGADPAVEDPAGRFLEVATSSMTVWPTYYWRRAMAALRGGTNLRPFGDGGVRPLKADSNLRDKLTKLLSPTLYCVTLDGLKAGLAVPEYLRARQRGDEMLVLLSHPKMLTRYSLTCLRQLLQLMRQQGDEVVGYAALQPQQTKSPPAPFHAGA